MEPENSLAAKFAVILPHLDERQRRLLLGAEAKMLGHGGIRAVARAAGVCEATVSAGIGELTSRKAPPGRVRSPGGGRKPVTATDPGLLPALLALIDPDERGGPMSPLRWTTRSTRNLAAELTLQGHRVGADTVAELLRAKGFRLRANAKILEGREHPDRDAQFRYVNEQAKQHRSIRAPVIYVDIKKEVPHRIYDQTADAGWVNVGCDHDTAAFAVESVRQWWTSIGCQAYPDAGSLLITADAGGGNGCRTRAWKVELARLAVETGLRITVCHLPPGTFQWHQVEHRLFFGITLDWRGRSLTSHQAIVETIPAATTRTGPNARAMPVTNGHRSDIQTSDHRMDALPLTSHDWHGDLNYTLGPEPVEEVKQGSPLT